MTLAHKLAVSETVKSIFFEFFKISIVTIPLRVSAGRRLELAKRQVPALAK